MINKDQREKDFMLEFSELLKKHGAEIETELIYGEWHIKGAVTNIDMNGVYNDGEPEKEYCNFTICES